jgi:hypothetical protein
MRRVACYAAESVVAGADNAIQSLNKLIPTVESWLKAKGVMALQAGVAEFTLRDGRSAKIDAKEYSTVSALEWDISVDEPTPEGRFLTRIVLGGMDSSLSLFVEMRAGVDGYRIAPHLVDVRCPQVLRDLLAVRTWNVGKTPVSTKPLRWVGQAGARKLLALLAHQERNLPVVVASEFDGRSLSPTLSAELARDLSGVAIVVQIDHVASWTVTSLRGKEWSCFDGAVRVYWPMHGSSKRAFDHPYWTRAKLIAATGSEAAAAVGIRNELRRRLLELSTYAADESVVLAKIRDEASRQKFEELRLSARERGEQEDLAEEYFNQCVSLSAELVKRNEHIGFLQDQVKNLSQVWKYSEREGTALAPEPEGPLYSVEEAVNRARAEFADTLLFGEDVKQSVRDVAADAGPPDKVFDHLRTLAEMAKIRQSGSLGKNMVEWFANNGISASYESEAVENNKAERQRRTWNDGNGRRMFSAHLKPNDGTSPDRCIRIYFEFDEDIQKALVGWVGRHP